uniref:Uncharacterized protein n=1 Tax=Lotus japonicus TaxID=34305 RepID=I3SWA1_LOTJA|nr:unknown [Lotus japonicus]
MNMNLYVHPEQKLQGVTDYLLLKPSWELEHSFGYFKAVALMLTYYTLPLNDGLLLCWLFYIIGLPLVSVTPPKSKWTRKQSYPPIGKIRCRLLIVSRGSRFWMCRSWRLLRFNLARLIL